MTNQRGEKDEEFTPSRGNVSSSRNAETETAKVKTEDKVKSETKDNNGRVISRDLTNQNVKTEYPEIKPENLGSSSVVSAIEWKRRAERAERLVIELVDERHRSDGLRGIQRRGQRARLSDDLRLLTDNNPPLDDDVDVEYLVIRRVNKGKDWVDVDFVDGDVEDEYEWCEGPFHQQTTIKELFGRKHRYDRHIRRRISGRKKVPLGESSDESENEHSGDTSSSSSDENGDGGSARSPEDTKHESDAESDGTEEYDQEESSGVEGPDRWAEGKARRIRRGGYRSSGLASFLVEKPVVERSISPNLKELKGFRNKPWRNDFRRKVRPGIPGIDANALFDIERRRLKSVSGAKSPTVCANGMGRFTMWNDGSPVPIWMRDRIERGESVSTVTALTKGLKALGNLSPDRRERSQSRQ